MTTSAGVSSMIRCRRMSQSREQSSARGWFLRRTAPPVYLPYHEEDRKRHYHELHDDIDEGAVRDDRHAGLSCCFERGELARTELHEEVLQTDAPRGQAHDGHDEVSHQRIDDLAEGGPDDDADGQVCSSSYIRLHIRLWNISRSTEGTSASDTLESLENEVGFQFRSVWRLQ